MLEYGWKVCIFRLQSKLRRLTELITAELRKNMSPDLIIHVVGSKADLAQTHSVVDLETARETIADWVDNSSDSATTSRSPSPPSSRNTNTLESVRPRTRTLSTQRLPTLGSVPSPRNRLPIITAPPTTAPPSFNPRTRTRLSSQISNNTPSIASNSSTLTSTTATPSVSSSFLFSDHIASSASEMTRSGSNFSIALSGLGLGGGNIGGGRSRRGTDEGRKGFEDLERIKEEKRQERIRACGITVTEVSAKDDIGRPLSRSTCLQCDTDERGPCARHRGIIPQHHSTTS
jgi:hypothetical protein